MEAHNAVFENEQTDANYPSEASNTNSFSNERIVGALEQDTFQNVGIKICGEDAGNGWQDQNYMESCNIQIE